MTSFRFVGRTVLSLRNRAVFCASLLLCGCAATPPREAVQRLGGRGHDIAFAVAAAPDGGARIVAELAGLLLGNVRNEVDEVKKGKSGVREESASTDRESRAPVVRDAEEDEEAEERGSPAADADAEASAPFALPRTRVAAVVAYDSRAQLRWALPLSGDGSLVSPRAIAVGGDGSTYVAGRFPRRLEILAKHAPDPLVAVGGADAFVLAVDRTGRPRWLRSIGGVLADNATAIAAAADGGCWVVGSFSGTTRVGQRDTDSLSAEGGVDTYIARFAADGRLHSLRAIGGAGNDEPIAFALAPDGVPYLLMRFTAALEVETPDGARRFASEGADDGLLLRLSGDAAIEAAVAIGSSKPDNLTALAADTQGAFVAGTLAGARDLHIGDGRISLASRGAADAVLLRFDRDLHLQSHGSIGGDGAVNVTSATYDVRGQLWLAGNFSGRLEIGDQTWSAEGADGIVFGIDADLRAKHARVLAGQGVQQIYGLASNKAARLLTVGTYTKQLVVAPGAAPLASSGRSDAFFVPLTPPQ